jgi:peptidoglycan/LPS O-acetylase OafA/YrhL
VLSQVNLLFILYGAPSIAALLFLFLGFWMARSRFEIGIVGTLSASLVLVHVGELWFLWTLREAWGGGGQDLLLAAGSALAIIAAALTWWFVARGLRRAGQLGP